MNAAFAVSATLEAQLIDERNRIHKEDMKNNLESLNELDIALPEIRELQRELANKKRELAERQQNLIKLQQCLLHVLNKSEEPGQTDYGAAVDALTCAQERMFEITEKAAEERQTRLPLSVIVGLADAWNDLFDRLVGDGVIAETGEENRLRSECLVEMQRICLAQMAETASSKP